MFKHTLASQWHALGLYTFPVQLIEVKPGKFTKRPAVEAWRKVAIPEAARDYQNYGVRLDRRFVVVDVDVKNGKRGATTWLKMRSMLKDPSVIDDYANRLQIVTMSGGRHHIFRLPDGMQIQKNPPGFPDIDFLSEGSFFVGPGTNFGTGNGYEIISGAIDLEYIPPYPEEWQIPTVKRETELRLEDRDFTNSPAAIQQFTDYCTHAPAAVENFRGDDTTYKVALAARDLGLDDDHCFRIMWDVYNPRCQPEWDEGAMEVIVKNAYAYGKGGQGQEDYSHLFDALTDATKAEMDDAMEDEGYKWNITKSGTPVQDDENNIICYLKVPNRGDFVNELWGLFRYNAFTDLPEYVLAPPWYNPATALDNLQRVPKAINDAELGSLKHFLFQKYGYVAERKTIYKAIDFVSRHQTYHPIRSWFKTLVWDGTPRLDDWLVAYCDSPDSQYARLVAPKVIIGAVTRIMEPGCKMDYTLVLEGEQGSGKSTVCEILGLRREWYAMMRPDMDKDARQVLSRKWIVEFAEIDALGKHEAAKVKQFMANGVDTYRPPYGVGPMDFPRQSIFIGTVNPGASLEYLNDPTGGRRFWPIETGDIDTQALRRNVTQLYAEAYVRYQRGERPFVPAELERLLKVEVKERQYIDPFVERIRAWWVNNPDELVANIHWLATNVCGVDEQRYDGRIRKRMLDSLSYLGWRITGKLKHNTRPPINERSPLPAFLPLLPQELRELRQRLTYPREFTYQYLMKRWDLGILESEDKNRLSRALRDLNGVTTEWNTVKRCAVVTIQPWDVPESKE